MAHQWRTGQYVTRVTRQISRIDTRTRIHPGGLGLPLWHWRARRPFSSASSAARLLPAATPVPTPPTLNRERDCSVHHAGAPIPPVQSGLHIANSGSSIRSATPTPSSSSSSSIGSRFDRPLVIHSLTGITPFTSAWSWQKRIVRAKIDFERALKARSRSTEQPPGPPPSPPSPDSFGFADRLLLVEHEPIYTLGRNSTVEHLRFPAHVGVTVVDRGELTTTDEEDTEERALSDTDHTQKFRILRVERGGEVTYHGPGQLVMYPLLALNPTPITPPSRDTEDDSSPHQTAIAANPSATDVRRYRADLHWFLRSLESVIIRFLRLYDIEGERIEGASGVWIRLANHAADAPLPVSPHSPLKKIAAVGLSCSSWVTMHGCALNVDACLEPFEWIVPCGLDDPTKFGGVTSLKQAIDARRCGTPIDAERVRRQLAQCFVDEFGLPHAQVAHVDQLPAELQRRLHVHGEGDGR